MLRNLALLAATLVVILGLFIGTENEIAHSFQTCISQNTAQQSAESPQKKSYVIRQFVGSQVLCTLRLIDSHNGFFAALASLIVAVFTVTIWNVNRSQLAHSHQVERAYISGGGAPEVIEKHGEQTRPNPNGAGESLKIPVGVERALTGDFILCINNFGKTLGEMFYYNANFCEFDIIPLTAQYGKKVYWHDWIEPGVRARPIASLPIPMELRSKRWVIYGRFYYQDIFGAKHSSGFIQEGDKPIEVPGPFMSVRDDWE